MAGQTSSWSTTFFWEQDLRSLYMNGLLNSILKPGIYNANIGIFATSGTAENTNVSLPKAPGIYLYLKRGTTFVFSNNYLYDTQSEPSRILSELENPGNFLIKSVVIQDTFEPIITTTNNNVGGGTATSDLKAFFGYDPEDSGAAPDAEKTYIPLPEIYITTMMKFNGEGALDTTAGYDSKPVFSWVVNKGSKYITAQLSELEEITAADGPFNHIANLISNSSNYASYGQGYYFLDSLTLNQSNLGYYDHLFPAEGQFTGTEGPYQYFSTGKYDRTSYLMVGRCLRVRNTLGGKIAYINSAGAWDDFGASGTGVSAWNRDYVFTAAGLPAYRQDQAPGQVSSRPSIMPILDHSKDVTSKLSTATIDGTLTPVTSSENQNPSNFTFNLKNLSIKNRLWSYSAPNDYYSSLVLCNSLTDNNFKPADYSSRTSELSEGSQAIVDFFYLLVREPLNRAQGIEIRNLLNSASDFETEIKQFDFITADSAIFNKLRAAAPVANYAETMAFKKKYESFNLLLNKTTAPSSSFSEATSNIVDNKTNMVLSQVLSPLDVSPINIQRLQEILESSNFLNNVIDYFRQSAPDQLRLDVNSNKPADLLIPLALMFRPIIKAGNTFKSGDGVATLDGLVNPANVLDFFSLQASGSRVHTVSLGDNDLYTILPVMD